MRHIKTILAAGVIAAAIAKGNPRAAQDAVETNWQNAAERLSDVIEEFGERGIWHLWDGR